MNDSKRIADIAFEVGVKELRNALLEKLLEKRSLKFEDIEKISQEVIKNQQTK